VKVVVVEDDDDDDDDFFYLFHIFLLPPPISHSSQYGILKRHHHYQQASCFMKCSPAPAGCTQSTTSLNFIADTQGVKHLPSVSGIPNNKSCVFFMRTVNTQLFSSYSIEKDGNDENSGGGGCTHEELLFK
jgi:hypothetical protein